MAQVGATFAAAHSPSRSERSHALHPRASWAFVGLATVAVIVFLADPESAAALVALAVIATGSIVAIEVGVRRNRPVLRLPWRCMQAALTVGLLGALLRGILPAGSTGILLVAEIVALTAYPLLFAFLFSVLRARDPQMLADIVVDGVLLGIAAFLVPWVLLFTTGSSAAELPLTTRLIENAFPVADAVVVFVLARMNVVSSAPVRALWLVGAAFLALLVGDLLWLLDIAQLVTLDGRLLEAPYLYCYGLMGAGALHPSMRVLTEPAPSIVRPLPRSRLFIVLLTLAVPAFLVLARPLADQANRAVVATGMLVLAGIVLFRTIRAVNQHAASELRLAHRATHDALTGLPNRVRLIERINAALADATGRVVAVLFVDLDNFKLVNDTWGHTVGDELLVAAGSRLSGLQGEHRLVARTGGDEFVLVCDCHDLDADLQSITAEVLARFAEPFVLSVGEVFATVSIGVSVARRPDTCTPEDLIRDADIAMYRAKADGRNRWALFDESLRRTIRNRLQVEVELRRALERGELLVHYQPIVRLADGALQGFEALVRWGHPERGLLPPAEFIPVIEDNDLILAVGELVLGRAAEQLVFWQRRRGPDLYVAVNVAGRQLRDPAFVDTVRRVLETTGCPSHALRLEVAESAMVEDPDASLAKLQALRQLGVGVSVDDFGTGHSSLSYLKKFPVTSVKIDRTFVGGLGSDRDDEAIVAAVLAMAHALGLDVVAEGVETLSQRDRLRALGCDAAQGFLFGRPAPLLLRTGASEPDLTATWPDLHLAST